MDWSKLWIFLFWSSHYHQVSCSALCDIEEATICPSKNCSSCASTTLSINETLLESNTTEKDRTRAGRSGLTSGSSDLRWCFPKCKLGKNPECCAHAHCEKKYPKRFKKKCKNRYFEGWCQYRDENFALIVFFSGKSCPWPPTPDHGQWTCKFLDAPMQDPISSITTWSKEFQTRRKSKSI